MVGVRSTMLNDKAMADLDPIEKGVEIVAPATARKGAEEPRMMMLLMLKNATDRNENVLLYIIIMNVIINKHHYNDNGASIGSN